MIKKVVVLPENVKFNFYPEKKTSSFIGPLGKVNFHTDENINISVNEENVFCITPKKSKTFNKFKLKLKALTGLYSALINNAIYGVIHGFKAEIELRGLGYKADIQERQIFLDIGFTHQVIVDIPMELSVDLKGKNIVSISGCSKQQVFWFASKLKKLRKPNRYKGFGIFFVGEFIKLKPINKK